MNCTLTTSVDAVNGGAGDDTIVGMLGASATYTVGDNINGGAGTDTLNLIDDDAASFGLVSLDSVENVNVRLLTAATTELNAADWSGVAVLSNASSLSATTLEVSGLESTTNVTLYGNTDVSIQYAATTTGNAVGTIVNAGTFAGATDIFASATANATAHLDFDLENTGLVSGIAVAISGTNNYARLEGGSNAEAYTVNGEGNATLVTDDLVVAFNAAAASGNVDITLQGASDAVVTGGAGNDVLRLGTTFSNGDSFDGGAGTDTIRATVSAFNRNLNTSNVESAVLTFSESAGGDVNASGSTVTSFTFAASTADNAASVSQIANGATITLNDDSIGAVTLDYASGATTTTLNIGSPSGTVGIGTLTITDVANVAINAVGVSGSVGGSIATASFDSDLKSLAITTSGGEADLVIGSDDGDVSLGGATSLTITSNGSASISMATADLAGTALASVTVAAQGSDAGDITLGDISGAALTSLTLSGTTGADVVVGTLDLGNGASATSMDVTLNIVQGATSDVTIGAVTDSGQGTLTINLSQNGTGSVADIAAVTIVKTGTADAVTPNLTFGAMTVAENGSVLIDSIAVGSGTGAQITFGEINVGQDGGYSAGAITVSAGVLNADISAVTLTVGASATATFGNIAQNSGGAVGAVTLTLLSDATATFGTVTASAISTHTIVAATGASANFGAMTAEQTIDAISIGGVDGADVGFGAIGASAVGSITVSGAVDASFGTITAVTIGEINTQGQGASGSFTIDLSGVTNAVEVKLGVGSNTIVSGVGNDVITLTGGRTGSAGNDIIRYTTATQGTDNIINFIGGAAASGGDVITLKGSAMILENGDGTTADANDDVALLVLGSTSSAMAAGTNIVVMTSAAANTAAMINQISSQLSFGSAMASAQSNSIVVVWTDGSDSYLTTVLIGLTGATSTTTALSSANSVTAVGTLAVIQGVTPGALVAANFDFV